MPQDSRLDDRLARGSSLFVLRDPAHFASWVNKTLLDLESEGVAEYTTEPGSDEARADLLKYKGDEYEAMQMWKRQNAIAKRMIIERLSPALQPEAYPTMKAHELWSCLADMCKPRGTKQVAKAVQKAIVLTLANCDNSASRYVQQFRARWGFFHQAVEQCAEGDFALGDDTVKALFVTGTVSHSHDLFASWREALWNLDALPPLEDIISSFTQESAAVRRAAPPAPATPQSSEPAQASPAITLVSQYDDREEACQRCRHDHKNSECWNQHPDLRPKKFVVKTFSKPKATSRKLQSIQNARTWTRQDEPARDTSPYNGDAYNGSPRNEPSGQADAWSYGSDAGANTPRHGSRHGSQHGDARSAEVRSDYGDERDVFGCARAISEADDDVDDYDDDNGDDWIYDTGASTHICNDLKLFREFESVSPPIAVEQASGRALAHIRGEVELYLHGQLMTLQGVLYLPASPDNLISASRLKHHSSIRLDMESSTLKRGKNVVAVVTNRNNVWVVHPTIPVQSTREIVIKPAVMVERLPTASVAEEIVA